jgi:hypothetical protein
MLVVEAKQSKTEFSYLSTSLAHVRLLASVDTLVDGQGGALDELLAAVGVVAHVRADTAVDTFCMLSVLCFWCCGPSFLTMTCEVTASREAFTTGRAREGLWRTRVRCGAPTVVLVLDLRIRHLLLLLLLLLRVRVVWRVGNVVVIIEHRNRRLHLRGRWVAQAVHVLLGNRWVRGELLLRLLRRVARRV